MEFLADADRPVRISVVNRKSRAAYYGFRAVEAVDGYEALQRAAELEPAIILMNLMMPSLDGFETTRRLKAGLRTCHIPVIALTALGQPEEERRARQAGCDAFLVKPVHPEELLREVRRVLEEQR